MYRHFKRQASETSKEIIWTWLRNGKFKRETETFEKCKNSVIRTNYLKAKIDKMQQNRKCWLCGDRDEKINYECGKLAQREYETRHNEVEKVINWELS